MNASFVGLTRRHAITSACESGRLRAEEAKVDTGRAISVDEHNKELSRRSINASILFLAALAQQPQGRASALTVQDVTPEVAQPPQLSPVELSVINVFERNTYSVVNVVDNALQVSSRMAQVDQPEGNGTGFIWDEQGHVITNFHVLGSSLLQQGPRRAAPDSKIAQVTLLGTDGVSQTYDGYLVGADRSKDLAVLKINAPKEKLQPVSLGDSDKLRVGQQVLCIGNPFGFDHTLTTGVISGVGREIQSRAGVLIGGGIQTDAAINPGNSGGPLLDSSGKLIGVNTAIFTNSGTSAGVGFAISAAAVARAVPQLIQFGKVTRPSLRIQVAGDQVASSLRVGRGALVQAVEPSSNAAKAGLQGTRRTLSGIAAGDVIIALGERQVSSAGDLVAALDTYNIGDEVVMQIRRDSSGGSQGKSLSLSLTLQEEIS